MRTPIELRPSMPAPVPIFEGRYDPDAIKSTLVGTPRRSLWVVTLDAAATGETYDTWVMKVPQGVEARGEGDQRDFYRISDGRPLDEDALLYPSAHPLVKPLQLQYTPSPFLAEIHHDFAVATAAYALENHYKKDPEPGYPIEDPLAAELPLKRRLAAGQHAFPGLGNGREALIKIATDQEDSGDYIDTLNLTQEVLTTVGFSDPLARAAMRAIDLINDGSDLRFFQASHYRTREEIEDAAGKHATQALIAQGYIELHPKWYRALTIQPFKDGRTTFISTDPNDHFSHPQAPYRISLTALHETFYPEKYN